MSSTKDKHPLETCPACGCRDLFTRKNFPQKLGLAIVVMAALLFIYFAAEPSTFYIGALILAGAVIFDALLYLFIPKITVCYRCRAEFKDVPINPKHEGFELAVGEKYRGQPPG